MSGRARRWAPALEAKRYAEARVPVAPCAHCDDGDGHCAFPYYGAAPAVLPAPNFRPDPDAEGLGTFTHCPACGAGANDED